MLLLPPSTSYLKFERKFQMLQKYVGHSFHLTYTHLGLETEQTMTISEFAISVTGDLVVYTEQAPRYRLIPQLRRLLHYFGYDKFYVNHQDSAYYLVDNGKTRHVGGLVIDFDEMARTFERIHNEMIMVHQQMMRALVIPPEFLFDFGTRVGLEPLYQPTYQRTIKIRGKKELRKIMRKLKDNKGSNNLRFYPTLRV